MRNVQGWWQRKFTPGLEVQIQGPYPRIPTAKVYPPSWLEGFHLQPSLTECNNYFAWLTSFLIILHLRIHSETSSRREWDINLVLKTLENVQLSHLTPDTPGEETISFTPIMSLVKPWLTGSHLDLDASVIGTAAAKAGPYAKQGRSHSPISVPRQNMSSHKAGPARVDSGIYYLSQSVLLFITTTPAKNNQKSQITYFTSVRTAGPRP